MKTICSITLFIFLSIFIGVRGKTSVPQGKVYESKSMESKILGRLVKYSIYLPADYELSNRSYPVLYLLHGYTDNETAWVQFGEINATADNAIANREAPPMIIVMPDAGVSWYINDYAGKVKYEDMFFEEFIPYIEKNYRIRNSKEFRAVGGLSMGGYGALVYSFRHPEMFSSCVALSAGLHTDGGMLERLKINTANNTDVFGPLKTDSLPSYWKEFNVLNMAKNISKEKLIEVKYYIDCGDKDKLTIGNCNLHLILKDRGVPHEFRVREGDHNWEYWRTGIVDGLKFIGNTFHR
jgi:S-formylglutathione hydrolase FrmB